MCVHVPVRMCMRVWFFWQSSCCGSIAPSVDCFPPAFTPGCPAPPPGNLGCPPKQTLQDALQCHWVGGAVSEAGRDADNGRVLARPSLLIIWAETQARLLNKSFSGAKTFGGPGVQWVKFYGNLHYVWQLQEAGQTSPPRLVLVDTKFISKV